VNEAIRALQNSLPGQRISQNQRPVSRPSGGQDFSSALQAAKLEFSNHAQNRLEHRKIQLTQDGFTRLNQAVEKAARRGGKESLVIMDELAFIVNVPERKVVTAMKTDNQQDRVFTEIDSVVLAD